MQLADRRRAPLRTSLLALRDSPSSSNDACTGPDLEMRDCQIGPCCEWSTWSGSVISFLHSWVLSKFVASSMQTLVAIGNFVELWNCYQSLHEIGSELLTKSNYVKTQKVNYCLKMDLLC